MTKQAFNPTEADVKAFCANLEKTLSKAARAGLPVALTWRGFGRDIVNDAGVVLDRTHTGDRIIIEIGAPAARRGFPLPAKPHVPAECDGAKALRAVIRANPCQADDDAPVYIHSHLSPDDERKVFSRSVCGAELPSVFLTSRRENVTCPKCLQAARESAGAEKAAQDASPAVHWAARLSPGRCGTLCGAEEWPTTLTDQIGAVTCKACLDRIEATRSEWAKAVRSLDRAAEPALSADGVGELMRRTGMATEAQEVIDKAKAEPGVVVLPPDWDYFQAGVNAPANAATVCTCTSADLFARGCQCGATRKDG